MEPFWNHGYDLKAMKNLEKIYAILKQFTLCVVSKIDEKIIYEIVLVMFKSVHITLIFNKIYLS